jgi:preprotein translocase subunit SecD
MNRNDTVLQLAILLVIIAILGVALLKHNDTSNWWSWNTASTGSNLGLDTVPVLT